MGGRTKRGIKYGRHHVSFRITTCADGDGTTIRVEGRLATEGLRDLRREYELAVGPVILDLSGLTSADADGLQAMLDLSAKGAKLCGASAYIRQLLDQAS